MPSIKAIMLVANKFRCCSLDLMAAASASMTILPDGFIDPTWIAMTQSG
jgi:hypothetical protein